MVDWNLIKCALGYHKYDNPIKNDTTNTLERYCIYCDKLMTIKQKIN